MLHHLDRVVYVAGGRVVSGNAGGRDHERDAERPLRRADRGAAHLGRAPRRRRHPEAPRATTPTGTPTDVRSYPFMVNALEAGTIVAVMAAVAGWFMVLRRQSFAGHTLSVMSFPGASGAALLGIPLAAGYFGACAAAALVIAAGSRGGDRPRPQPGVRGRRDRPGGRASRSGSSFSASTTASSRASSRCSSARSSGSPATR